MNDSTYDLPCVNRNAVMVKPTQLFFEWARKTPDLQPELTLDDLRREGTVYLIPEGADDKEVNLIIKRNYSSIFEFELYGWCIDPSTWVQKRSYAKFKKWFDVEVCSMVIDLAGDLIETE